MRARQEEAMTSHHQMVALLLVGVFCPSKPLVFSSVFSTRSRSSLYMSEDSWSAELRQAGGGLELEESSAFFKRASSSDQEEARVANDRLVAWLEGEGAWLSELSGWNQAPHPLALATSTVDEYEGEDSGRGLLARRAVTQDQELIRLSLKCCMTKEAALRCPELKGVVSEDTNEYVAIAALLITETGKGDSSYWAPYINVLPSTEDISATFTWSEEDLVFLEGSPCLGATRSMQEKLRAEHLEKFPFEKWEWAFSILFSRAIRLGGARGRPEILGLVPYVDFINHSPFSSSYVSLATQDSFFGGKGEDEVVVFSDRSYKKFQQVFISYGPKSNSDLLLLYGFALDRNPFNSVAVRFGASANDPLYKEKIEFAKSAGRAADGTEAFPLYADRFADEMLQFLRMICVTEKDLQSRDLSDIDFSIFVSRDNELAVLDTIKQACADAVVRYDAAAEQNSALLRDTPNAFLSRKQRMAKRLVASELAILKRTVDAATRKASDITATMVA